MKKGYKPNCQGCEVNCCDQAGNPPDKQADR